MVGGTPASSTTKTGRHDIAEILLKVALNTKNQIKSTMPSLMITMQHKFIFYFTALYLLENVNFHSQQSPSILKTTCNIS